jgi:hypothetical protein
MRRLPVTALLFGSWMWGHTPAVAASRAVWVWEEDAFRFLEDKRFQKDTTAFLDQHHISTIYLYADEYRNRNLLTNEAKKYRQAIRGLHKRGLKVYALLGSDDLKAPEYILPEKRAIAERVFQNVLIFNAAADTSERFDGINMDIEPYLLDDWDSRRELRIRQYLELSTQWMRMKADMRSTISVGVAVPFWFDAIKEVEWNGKKKNLNEHVQDIYDYIVIMDYRNFAEGEDGMISQALDELVYGDRINKKVMIGIDTLAGTPAKITFAATSSAYMEQQLERAEAAFVEHPSFAGFIIHHLSSYRGLLSFERN